MKFLDVRTDYAFKKVFGSEHSKPQLLSFLNAVLSFPEGQRIVDLTIVDPYSIPLIKGMKDTYVDVKAKLDDETMVIIEMQVLNVEAFEKRILYNAAKNYSTQLLAGEQYNLLNPVIALTITDFVMFPESEKLLTRFKLIEKDEFIQYSDDIELVFVELPKFEKKLDELDNITERWFCFLKHAGDLDFLPESLGKEIQQALSIVNEASLSAEELEAQHKRKDFIWLQRGAIATATKDGLQKGLREGLEQGLEQGLVQGLEQGHEQGQREKATEIARGLLAAGVSISIISQTTGLTADDISELSID